MFIQPRVPSHTITEEEEPGTVQSSDSETQNYQILSSNGTQEKDSQNQI